MLALPTAAPPDEVYSADEVARAAHVSRARVLEVLGAGQRIRVGSIGAFVAQATAVRLVRMLGGLASVSREPREPLTLIREPKRRSGLSLIASSALHGAFFATFFVGTWLGLLKAHDTEQVIKNEPVRLVYLMSPGPGGGGGGGGLHIPAPPPPAERKAPAPKKISSPVPLLRKPPPPAPVITPPRPRVDPPKPPPLPMVQAPVVPVPADPIEKPGVLEQSASTATTNGPGAGGGVGAGAGTGLGEGQGSGIGAGSGGGMGGGPYQPGNGIEPPTLLREVKPLYTDEARRRSIEGEVALEIVVRRDGSVGDVHVTRALGAGLDQRAIDAVRQWRFGPARRQGSPVDVIVEVLVGFKLR